MIHTATNYPDSHISFAVDVISTAGDVLECCKERYSTVTKYVVFAGLCCST